MKVKEAIALLRTQDPDLILVDLQGSEIRWFTIVPCVFCESSNAWWSAVGELAADPSQVSVLCASPVTPATEIIVGPHYDDDEF